MENPIDLFAQHCVVFDIDTSTLYWGPNETQVLGQFNGCHYLVMEQWDLSRIREAGCQFGEPGIEISSPVTHDILVPLAQALREKGYSPAFQIHYKVNGNWTMTLVGSLLNEN
jgi:hypothetical protein